MAHPGAKDLRYSKDLPGGWLPEYRRAMSDPAPLEQLPSLALIDAQIVEQLRRIEESAPSLEMVRAAHDRLKTALGARNWTEASKAMSDMDAAFRAAAPDARDKLAQLIDLRRRVVSGEVKRIRTASQVLTAAQVMAILAAMTEAVKRHVRDQIALAAIGAEFARALDSAQWIEGRSE